MPTKRFPQFDWLTNGSFFAHTPLEIPVPAVLLLIVAVAAAIILSQTRIGRYLFSIGNNEQAINYIRKSLEEGFKEREKFTHEPEFAGLRNDPEFQKIMAMEPKVL